MTHSEGGTEVSLKLDNGYAGVHYAHLLYLPMFEIVVKYIKVREEWKRETSESDLQRGRQGLKEDKGWWSLPLCPPPPTPGLATEVRATSSRLQGTRERGQPLAARPVAVGKGHPSGIVALGGGIEPLSSKTQTIICEAQGKMKKARKKCG